MTLAHDDPPTSYDEPDHLLDQQAAEYEPPRRPGRTQQAPPHDLDAERAALGAMILSLTACDTAITMGLSASHFYNPFHADVLDAITACLDAAEKPDTITIRARLGPAHADRASELIAMQTAGALYTNVRAYVGRVIFCAHARTTQGQALEIAQAAQQGDLPRAYELTTQLAETVATKPGSTAISHTPLGAFVDTDEPDHDWIIPGLLERTDRILLTGPEGGGKSTLLRQIAVQAAAGIHPFAHNDITPLRVLLLDLENSGRHVRRSLRALRMTAEGAADETLEVATYPQGLDLCDPDDVAALTQLIAAVGPDLVIGGPIYKLVGGDPTEEQPAKAAAMTLDRLRIAHGFALALETHQPHDNGGKRPERPYGASLWKRWPEFGLHIAETGQLRHWRGARDEREWPAALQRGGAWPWSMEVDSKLLTFARIVELTREHGRRLSERELSNMTGAPKTNVHNAIQANKARYDALCDQVEL